MLSAEMNPFLLHLQGISVDPTDPTRFFQQEDNSTKASRDVQPM